jgi:putative membrane protein
MGPDPRDSGDEIDPRFSFANERTFLAWIRTALALISVGLAVIQLLPPFDVPGGRRIIGLPLIAIGAAVAVVALRQWGANERAMREGRPLPSSRIPLLVALAIAVVGALALAISLGGGE